MQNYKKKNSIQKAILSTTENNDFCSNMANIPSIGFNQSIVVCSSSNPLREVNINIDPPYSLIENNDDTSMSIFYKHKLDFDQPVEEELTELDILNNFDDDLAIDDDYINN